MQIQPDEPMGPGWFIFFQPVVDVRPSSTNSGGGRYFTWSPDRKTLVTKCPIPEAEKHCERAEDEFPLFKFYLNQVQELSALIAGLQKIPRITTVKLTRTRFAQKKQAERELKVSLKKFKVSERIIEAEEEAIIALMFNEK